MHTTCNLLYSSRVFYMCASRESVKRALLHLISCITLNDSYRVKPFRVLIKGARNSFSVTSDLIGACSRFCITVPQISPVKRMQVDFIY